MPAASLKLNFLKKAGRKPEAQHHVPEPDRPPNAPCRGNAGQFPQGLGALVPPDELPHG